MVDRRETELREADPSLFEKPSPRETFPDIDDQELLARILKRWIRSGIISKKAADELFGADYLDEGGKDSNKLIEEEPTRELFEAEFQGVIERVNWKMLNSDEVEIAIVKHISSFCADSNEKGDHIKICLSRLLFLKKQKPDHVVQGLNEFKGYLAFVFSRFGRAVLDSAREGNAIYVFGMDWEELSQLSKTELLRSGLEFDRIIHKGDWKTRLLRSLTL